MLFGELRRPELIPSDRALSPLGRMRVPYIYPAGSGEWIRVRGVAIGWKRLCFMLTGK